MFRKTLIAAALVCGIAGAALAQPNPAPKTTAAKTVAKAPVAAPAWTVDTRASRVSVSETVTGLAFTFDSWSADLRFDPANLAGSSAVVTLNMASAQSGDSSNDSTLRNDWLGARQHPQAVFRATGFRALGANRYEAPGSLTIRGRTYAVVFTFTAAITGNQAVVTGQTSLDRAAMGFTIDPQFDWVSRMVTVNVSLRANRAG